MILVGNQRGGARDLARHLMKDENERVEVHQLRGFVSDDLDGAFEEAYAISRGTRCKQFLFSLSLNPPQGEDVSVEAFEAAIDQAEAKLGLTGQPRAVVFHEKRGDDGELRRHAHAVWSRIDGEEMKAVQLSHSKRKLNDVARDLYLEHGWKMPHGLAVSGARDPRNFTLAEWQQAKRQGDDPREVKASIQDAWAISDSKAAFAHALQERGYWLAAGDRRGFLAVNHRGKYYSVSKYAGLKPKQVRERLGDLESVSSLAETKLEIAKAMQAKMQDFQTEVKKREERQQTEAARKRETLKARQKAERDTFKEATRLRTAAEEKERQKRFRTGLFGFWDRLTGKRTRTLKRNAQEAAQSKRREQHALETLSANQLVQRKQAVTESAKQRTKTKAEQKSLIEDAKVFRDMEAEAISEREARREAFKKKRRRTEDRPRRRSRQRDGPSL